MVEICRAVILRDKGTIVVDSGSHEGLYPSNCLWVLSSARVLPGLQGLGLPLPGPSRPYAATLVCMPKCSLFRCFKKHLKLARYWWLMPVILATLEAETVRIIVRGQPGEIVHEIPSPK
jgi:hypothetical protein